MAAYIRAVMTIREKFADPKFLISKYKGELMVVSFFYIIYINIKGLGERELADLKKCC
jgi:hypothetical protein